jgi:predicted nucleotidyltransferase component of viral defense system
LKVEQQENLFTQAATETGLPTFAIEKDAWVTLVLRMLFSSELKEHIVFKGETSLSKVYGLIDRFSEDIDISIDKEYLGFEGDLSKGQIRKLRRKSHLFSLNEMPGILKKQFEEYGIDENKYIIEVPNTEVSDQDPEIIHLQYDSLYEEENYLPTTVKVELGARSLNEPFEQNSIGSLIDTIFPNDEFSEEAFKVRSILPGKTFLEKLILLHEEFQKPEEKVRYLRMSRHLYDIYQIGNTSFGEKALADTELFREICNHRAVFTPIHGVIYNELNPTDLAFIPPEGFIDQYRADYQEMQSNMIYGDSPNFDEPIDYLNKLRAKLQSAHY